MPLRPVLEATYVRPELRTNYAVTSPASDDYNCIAWAAGREDVWAWPGSEPYHWWPSELPTSPEMEAIAAFFAALGYEPTESFAKEDGYEKVEIYGRDGGPTHAARQLPDSSWTSKVGAAEDVRHDSLAVFETESGYGSVVLLMRRAVS